jgi:hypothetical protein
MLLVQVVQSVIAVLGALFLFRLATVLTGRRQVGVSLERFPRNRRVNAFGTNSGRDQYFKGEGDIELLGAILDAVLHASRVAV